MSGCTAWLSDLSRHLDDEGGESERRRVARHLRACPTCGALYDSTRKTIRLVSLSAGGEPPSGLADRIMDRLRKVV